MSNPSRTKSELIKEISTLKKRIQELEQSETERKQAEESPREVQARYRLLFEQSPYGILIIDPATARFVEFNETAHRQLGYSREEFARLSIADFEVGESPEETLKHIEKVIREGRDDFETTHRTRQGEIRHIHVTAQMTKISGLAVYHCVWHDITERKRAEEQLVKLNELFLKFGSDPVANINLLVAFCGEMFGGTCALYNRLQGGMLCTLGQWNTPSDFKSIDQPEGHLCHDVIKSDGDNVVIIRNLQDSPYAQTDPNVRLYQLQTYIGKAVEFGDTNMGSLCVVFQRDVIPRDNDTRLMGIIASAIGVEEKRKRAEEALLASEAQLKAQYQGSPIPTFIWQKRGGRFQLVDYNQAAKVAGKGEVTKYLGKYADEMYQNIPEILKNMHRCFTEKEVIQMEVQSQYFMPGRTVLVTHAFVPPDLLMFHGQDITDRKRSEEALRASQLRLSEAMDLAHIVYWEFDPLAETYVFNDPLYALYGTTAEQEGGYLMAREDYAKRFIHPDDLPLYYQFAEQNTSRPGSESVADTEHRIIRRDGEVRYILVRTRIVKDDSGYVVKRYGANQDITDRKRGEEALFESEAKYRTVVENSLAGVYILQDNLFHYVNKRFCEMYGYAYEEIVDTLSPMDITHPEDRHIIRETARKISGGLDEIRFTHRAIKKDGATIMVNVLAGPITYKGRPALSGTVLDITEQERTQKELLQKTALLEAQVNASLDGIIIVDKGRKILQNQQVNDLLKIPWHIVENDDDEVQVKWVKGLAKHPEEFYEKVTYMFAHPDETMRDELELKDGTVLDRYSSPVIGKGGKHYGRIWTFRDITDRKLLESQLLQAGKLEAIGTLAGGVAHDFNNILMGIQGYASLMMLEIATHHPNYERLKRIEEQIQSASDLTRQLLGFARGGKYEMRPADMNEIIRKTSSMFGRTKKELTIHGKYGKDLWTVEVDRGQIEQVLLNLYVNAWHAMPGGGELYLETGNVVLDENYAALHVVPPGKYVRVSVADTGIGMEEETKKRIFDPFFTTKEMGRGTGLGLAMVYGIMKGHKGFVDVYSEPGHGTTFALYLPASEKKVLEERPAAPKTLRGSETILLVDDEPAVLAVNKQILESLGYTVHEKASGQEAIAFFGEMKNDIDLVILDMIMPGLSGSETFDRIMELNPSVKVILSSGYSLDGQAQQIMDRGCRGFIQKPFDIARLSRKVREVLEK